MSDENTPSNVSGTTPTSKTAETLAATPAKDTSLEDVIQEDYRLIQKGYDRFLKLRSSDVKEAEKWKNFLIKESSTFNGALESVLYSPFQTFFGEDCVNKHKDEGKRLKESMNEVDKSKMSDAEMYPRMERAMKQLDQRVVGLKQNVTEMSKGMQSERVQELIKKYHEQKARAPTHPHPSAPTSGGIAEKMAESVSKPLDTIKDKSRDFPSDDDVRQLAEE